MQAHNHTDQASTSSYHALQDHQESASQPRTEAPHTSEAFSEGMQTLRSWCRGREHACLGAVVGLIVAFCIFSLGFLKTLIIAICVGLGIAFGQYIDGNPRMLSIVKKLFRDNRN